jgi:hypothetical protein
MATIFLRCEAVATIFSFVVAFSVSALFVFARLQHARRVNRASANTAHVPAVLHVKLDQRSRQVDILSPSAPLESDAEPVNANSFQQPVSMQIDEDMVLANRTDIAFNRACTGMSAEVEDAPAWSWTRAQSCSPTSLIQKSEILKLEKTFTACESDMRFLERRFESLSEASSAWLAHEAADLKGLFLELSHRLEALIADALEKACGRMPGAGPIFEQSTQFMDRVAQLMQKCEVQPS